MASIKTGNDAGNTACICSVRLHGTSNESWGAAPGGSSCNIKPYSHETRPIHLLPVEVEVGPNGSDLQWLHRKDHAMICWICGTKDWDETPSASLLKKLGIAWYSCQSFTVGGSDVLDMYSVPHPVSNLQQTQEIIGTKRWRPKKTDFNEGWMCEECVKNGQRMWFVSPWENKWSPWAHGELTAPGPNDHGSVTARLGHSSVTARSQLSRLGHSSVTARSQLNHGKVTAGCENLQYDHGSVSHG